MNMPKNSKVTVVVRELIEAAFDELCDYDTGAMPAAEQVRTRVVEQVRNENLPDHVPQLRTVQLILEPHRHVRARLRDTKTINFGEFEAVGGGVNGRPAGPLTRALRARIADLRSNTGFKVPCTWPHSPKTGSCSGVAVVTMTHRTQVRLARGDPSPRLASRCNNKTLYVYRYEIEWEQEGSK
jgi:hypothetical protein